jgi:hypothetical protein
VAAPWLPRAQATHRYVEPWTTEERGDKGELVAADAATGTGRETEIFGLSPSPPPVPVPTGKGALAVQFAGAGSPQCPARKGQGVGLSEGDSKR